MVKTLQWSTQVIRIAGLTIALAMSCPTAWADPSDGQMGHAFQGLPDTQPSGTSPATGSRALQNLESGFFQEARPVLPPGLDGEAAPRALLPTDDGQTIQPSSVLTRMSDGTVKRLNSGEVMRGSVQQDTPRTLSAPQVPLTSSDDPSFMDNETNRQVFGRDDRVQVMNTKVYPFKAFGYIQSASSRGKGSCSGTLIGPRTVLTAAHCLYSNEDKDWLSEIRFAPGMNGVGSMPFGVYEAESTSILEGFVSNYQGNYSSVLAWDLGIITLAEPIGDTLGWLGYSNYDELGDFTANIVGYPGDKDPPAMMWRVNCNVPVKNVGEANFDYDCDTYPGSSGSAVYAYDEQVKQRIIVGVNIAESTEYNTAVRLNDTYVSWINGLWK